MTDDVLRLLVIELSLEDAEHLLSTLRNAGIAVRPSSAEDEDELEGVLERQPLDLILANTSHDLTISKIEDAVARSGKDVPIIGLIDDYSPEAAVEAVRSGAVDAVGSENHAHMEAVVRREVANLALRRRVRRLETSLRETEKRCHALLDSSRDPIAYVHEGMHVYANPAYLSQFDYAEFEDLEGLPILDMVDSGDAATLKEALRKLSKETSPPEPVDVRIATPDGKKKEITMEFSPASIEGEPCTQIVLRDKSLDPELAQELKDLRTQDLVTGLHNRQYLLQAMDAAIAETVSSGATNALVYADIDNFRNVLDQVGLAGMDLILGDVAKAIRKVIGEDDKAGRLGDHSFAILLSGKGLEEAKSVAERLRAYLENHISEVGDQSITNTLSLGVTRIVESVSNGQDVLTMASGAAIQAAKAGGNRVEIHDPTKQKAKAGDDTLVWISRVKRAVQEDRFVLVYQPIVSLHGADDDTYEVLVRMQGDAGEEIAAGEFIPHLAGHDLMIKVDQWVMQHAIMAIKKSQTESPDKKVVFFIKLSTQTLNRPEVLPWFAKVLQKYRLSGDSLVFEVPESKLMTNLKSARQFLKGLKQLHCKFAIEQFGSGLNSFQILKHLPADYLKIDRSFMKDLPTNEDNQEKVKQISDQAHAMGKITIAEFVEDANSMSILWQCGVNFVQGNFLQEPEKVLSYDF